MSTNKPGINPVNLAQSKLQQEKLHKELEALRAEYREFVYAVAHDLTGPFRQIEGFTNIILSTHADQFDDKTKRQFDLIIGGTEKGKAILEALLAYSRLITSDLSIATVDCIEVIEDVKTELAPLIKTADADIQISDNSATTALKGDRAQLHQLFYHVIHNALHYRKPECATSISIEIQETELEWQFCITDDGMGIRGKMVERIFTPLKRGVAEKDYSGTGMGLTVAKSVVQRHGGKIWMTSEPGSGSSLNFTLSKEQQHD